MAEKIVASAPGRICLFGEHQDYLNLPVIAAAISLRINISARQIPRRVVQLDLPDINSYEKFDLTGNLLPYEEERDYFKSSVNVLLKNNFTFSNGISGIVKGEIPINSGASSSSALIVAWIKGLAALSDSQKILSPIETAEFAYSAEVAEFNEPGGKMDHYTSSLGGVVFLDFSHGVSVERLPNNLKTFVLGNSLEQKDTLGVLKSVKFPMLEIIDILKKKIPDFDLKNKREIPAEKFLTPSQVKLLQATLTNYDITLTALSLLKEKNPDHRGIGELILKHHEILSEDLKISTKKIDTMIDAALDAGAFGAKINGSGGGGTMFAYAPEKPERVAENIEKAGGKAFIVNVDKGAFVV